MTFENIKIICIFLLNFYQKIIFFKHKKCPESIEKIKKKSSLKGKISISCSMPHYTHLKKFHLLPSAYFYPYNINFCLHSSDSCFITGLCNLLHMYRYYYRCRRKKSKRVHREASKRNGISY